MNYWAQSIKSCVDINNYYANALLEEEFNKHSRLKQLSNSIGLPIYKNYYFILPKDIKLFENFCDEKLKKGWKLSLRLMDSKEEQLLFRNLDVDTKEALIAVEKLSGVNIIKANIRPYKIPSISGTLLVSHSDILLEIVFGPHNWLTKSLPVGTTIYNCRYIFPHLTVKYSTEEPNMRINLYRILKDIVDIVFGLSIRQLAEIDKSVYAEFIWNEEIGYRFYECSFSDVWTDFRISKK